MIMKKIINYIALGISLLASSLMVHAQNDGVSYNSKGGVSTNKTVVANGNGGYTITLETFATGTTTPVYSSTPVDVILVLDLSSSMDEDYSYKLDDGSYSTGTSRLDALIYASKKFATEIARNDEYDDDGNKRDKLLGNRIQIITFAGDNATKVHFNAFQPASTNLSSINSEIDDFSTSKGTRTDLGISAASTWVNTSKNATYWTTSGLKDNNDHNIVVVMFTDGCPSTSGSTNFTASYAVPAVNTAKTIKDNGAIVYSVGLIDWSELSTQNQTRVRNMMDYISSNFPDGAASTTNTFTCTGTRASSDYYKDANEVDLGEIFESIAKASGGSAEEIGSTTQIRDQASSSFVLPSGFNPSDDVTIEVYDVDEDGMGWTKNTSYDVSTISKTLSINSNKDTTLVISGFDYSKDDIKDENGYTTRANAGNWVGQRYLNKTTTFWAGKKIVVKFDIYAIDGATGGDATGTNAQGSGVYVWNTEKEEYECVNEYTLPTADLPINIKITKDGLRHGESATFEIHRFKPLKKMPEGGTTPADSVLVYNAINKPVPNPKTEENWTKVIITNKGADGASVTKTLLALDPSYIYSVIEDDWGWAYDLTGTVDGVEVETGSQNTSIVAVNPFTFHNKEKANTVKHAEAVTINHFATSATGKSDVETYKSSKVKSF